MSGGGKTSTSTSSVQIPPEVMARYNAVNQYASKVAETPYQPYQGQFVAPMTSTQNAAVANVNQAAGQAQPYFTGATESLLQGQQAATPYYGAAMDVYGGAYGLGAQLGQESYGALQGAQAAAQPYNQAATGLAAAGTQAVNPTYLGQGAINQYMSPYLNNVVGATMQAMNQQNQEQQSQLTSDAIKSGAFGGDRSGVAAANLAYKQNLANQQTLANLYNTGYGQALGTAQQQQGVGLGAQQANRAALQAGAGQMMGIGQQQFGQGAATAGQLAGLGQQQFGQGLAAGQQIAGLGQGVYGMGEKTAQNLAALGTGAQGAALQGASAQLAAGTQEQQTQQAQNAALYNQFLQQQGYPFQTAQFLANIAMGTGANSGSTTTTTQPTSFFSDKRLKENVHQVGETFDGQPIYRYNYKGQRGTQIGLIAQDVERKHPEAVGLAGGYKTVDYDRATEDAAHRGHFAYGGASMGGGVVPERAGEGFAFGGMVDKPFMSDNYFTHILNRVHGTPIGAGLGGQGQGLNIPQGSSAPRNLMVASPPPPPPNYGNDLRVAAENVKAIQDLFGAGKSALLGSAATDKSAETSGFAGAGGKWDPSKGWLGGLGAAHGGAIRGYATDGRVNDDDASPYGVPSFVPNEKPNIPALKTAPAGPGHSGGLGSDIMDVAKFGSSIAGLASLFGLSDKRLKENIHQIGKTFDGQPVYRYNYKGHPETQIGLIAQEVERKHPEAVGVAGNYKTVDYGRATEDAAHRGHFGYGGAPMGGLVSRHGFQAGGPPDESNDNSNPSSLPPDLRRIIDRNIAEQPANRAWSANRAVESGDRQFSSSGNPLTSKKGATGISQIMPSTGPEAAKLAGVEWDPERFASDANYNNQLGLAYFKHLHGTVGGGDAGLTAAAYNAGPGAAANAIGLARTRGGNPTDYLPQETFEHTNKVLTNLGMPNVPPGVARSIAAGSPQANAAAEAAVPQDVLQARRGVSELTSALAQRQKELLGEKREPSWFESNQAWLTPLLTGVATMASSPSRYLGSALLQGLGGAASSFGNVQNQISARRLQEQQALQAGASGTQNLAGAVSSLSLAGKTPAEIQQIMAGAQATGMDAAGRATMVDPNVARTRAEAAAIPVTAEAQRTNAVTNQIEAALKAMGTVGQFFKQQFDPATGMPTGNWVDTRTNTVIPANEMQKIIGGAASMIAPPLSNVPGIGAPLAVPSAGGVPAATSAQPNATPAQSTATTQPNAPTGNYPEGSYPYLLQRAENIRKKMSEAMASGNANPSVLEGEMKIIQDQLNAARPMFDDNIKTNMTAQSNLASAFDKYQSAMSGLQTIQNAFLSYQTGSGSPNISSIIAIGDTVLGKDAVQALVGKYRGDYSPDLAQEILKSSIDQVYQQLGSIPGGVKVAEIQGVSQTVPSTSLDPGANRTILSKLIGQTQHNAAFAKALHDQTSSMDQNQLGTFNLGAFKNKWVQEHKVQDYIDEAYKNTPVKGGTPSDPSKLVDGALYILEPGQKFGNRVIPRENAGLHRFDKENGTLVPVN